MNIAPSNLYWSLPTPAKFLSSLTAGVRSSRATAISFPRRMPSGTTDALRRALEAADGRLVVIEVGAGTDVAMEVGAQLNKASVTGRQLASAKEPGGLSVLLKPTEERAAGNCGQYFESFVEALEAANGNVTLLVHVHNEAKEWKGRAGVRVVEFDFALPYDEMTAYVGLRMLGRRGPGSTSLLRALVTEYAGFDVVLAERLMSMTASDLMRLPDSFDTILADDPLRWRTASWLEGSWSRIDGERHPLTERYLAIHQGPQQKQAEKDSQRRYWRACVKALTPWLEERRAPVMNVLRRVIDHVYASAGGVVTKPIGRDRAVKVKRGELEYNNIVGFANDRLLPPLEREDERRAVDVCYRAKKVRDNLAHLRAPSVDEVDSLVAAMDALFPAHPEPRSASHS
jgi:hypothetical protein